MGSERGSTGCDNVVEPLFPPVAGFEVSGELGVPWGGDSGAAQGGHGCGVQVGRREFIQLVT
jgi:hypothetical protein